MFGIIATSASGAFIAHPCNPRIPLSAATPLRALAEGSSTGMSTIEGIILYVVVGGIVLGIIFAILSPWLALASIVVSALGVVVSALGVAIAWLATGLSLVLGAVAHWVSTTFHSPLLGLVQLLRFLCAAGGIALAGLGVWFAFHWSVPADYPHWRTLACIIGGVAVVAAGAALQSGERRAELNAFRRSFASGPQAAPAQVTVTDTTVMPALPSGDPAGRQ